MTPKKSAWLIKSADSKIDGSKSFRLRKSNSELVEIVSSKISSKSIASSLSIPKSIVSRIDHKLPHQKKSQMTLKQEAYAMIDTMTEEELRAWLFLVGDRRENEKQKAAEQKAKEERTAKKEAAIEKLIALCDEMAPAFPPDFDPEQELIAALEEKYGPID